MTSEPLIRVIAAVVSRGDELLVCQRPHHKRHGGLWEFPGGKCEPGESDPDSPFLIVFTPVRISGEPACHEHIGLRWGRLRELASLSLAPSDRRYVEFRRERKPV